MPVTNNVTRWLDSKKIAYSAFELPEAKISAIDTAILLDVPFEHVYKTIVVLRQTPGGKPLLVLIPANCRLDLKALADFTREKKVRVPTLREAESITGLKAGGISPLALLNQGFQTIVDASAQTLTHLHVSGGQLGLNLRLPVDDLIKLTNARVAAIAVLKEGEDDEF